MTGGVTVRLARDDELEAAGDLVVAAYRTHPDMEDGHGYLAHVRDARGRAAEADVLVAVDEDGRLLGCVSYVRDHTSAFAEVEQPGEAGFRMLGVAPDGARPGRRAGAGGGLPRARTRARPHGRGDRDRAVVDGRPASLRAGRVPARARSGTSSPCPGSGCGPTPWRL